MVSSHEIKLNNPTVRKLNRLKWKGWNTREEISKLLGQSNGTVGAALRFLEKHGLIETKHKRSERNKAANCGRPKIYYRRLRDGTK